MELLEFAKKYNYTHDVVYGEWKVGELLPFQVEFFTLLAENRFTITKKSRQMYVSSMFAIYIAWYLLFTDKKDEKGESVSAYMMLVCPKLHSGTDVLERVRTILNYYERCGGKVSYNVKTKKQLRLSNGNQVTAKAATIDAFCSHNADVVIVDEAAYIQNYDEVYSSIIVLLTYLGKLHIASTPNGFNGFAKLYLQPDEYTTFVKHSILYHQNPKFNKPEWIRQMKEGMGEVMFKQEVLAEFFCGNSEKPIKDTLLQVRISSELERELGKRLIELDVNTSTYLRDLIEKDLGMKK